MGRGPKGSKKKWSEVERGLYDPANESSSAQNKLWSYVEGVLEKPEIRKTINLLRRSHGIAPEGSKKRPDDLNTRVFLEGVDNLRQKLGLDFIWSLTLADYVLHNELRWDSSFGGLIEVVDEYPPAPTDEPIEVWRILWNEKQRLRPVAIHVSPYASQRDIVDYIKRVYKSEIEPIQKKYRSPDILIGKLRKRDTTLAKIRDFIYKNRLHSTKEIAGLVAQKFGKHMDYPYVARILREERKKRRK